MDRLLCLLIYLLTALAGLAKPLARLGIGTYEEWKPGMKRKILLVGYNGARNTGSDVRVASIARQIQNLFGKDQVELSVLTLDADSIRGYFDEDVRLITLPSFFPLHLYRVCCASHAAVICEGSTLKSTFANALTLFMCEAAGIMSAQKKPCIAYGAEVGYMEPFLRKAASRLCRDTYFITRTEEAYDALWDLDLKGHKGTDAAWLYEGAISREEAEKLLRDQGWDGQKPILGIAVIDPFCWPVRSSLTKWIRGKLTGDFRGQYDLVYFFSQSESRSRAYRRYIRGIASGTAAFIRKHDYFPVLLGMEKLDEKACMAVKDLLPCQSAQFFSGEYTADIMTGILRKMDMLVTSRYHGAVLSMEGGAPIIAVSMDERLSRIMKELSLDSDYLFEAREKDLGNKLSEAMEKACADREAISGKIQSGLTASREELIQMGYFLKKILGDRGRFYVSPLL